MPDKISQKIIVNLDTSMSLGRLCAQAAHASLIAILNQSDLGDDKLSLDYSDKPELKYWLNGNFTKVILRGFGDKMLLDFMSKATEIGLPVGLMEEDGMITALAIGPSKTKLIDQVTKNLELL
jgi:peptidyl-tRNA hydrolase